jgi:hypothetical protein
MLSMVTLRWPGRRGTKQEICRRVFLQLHKQPFSPVPELPVRHLPRYPEPEQRRVLHLRPTSPVPRLGVPPQQALTPVQQLPKVPRPGQLLVLNLLLRPASMLNRQPKQFRSGQVQITKRTSYASNLLLKLL